jgi:hypothetical protein
MPTETDPHTAREIAFFDLFEHAGVLTAVKDKARFRARACGPP